LSASISLDQRGKLLPIPVEYAWLLLKILVEEVPGTPNSVFQDNEADTTASLGELIANANLKVVTEVNSQETYKRNHRRTINLGQEAIIAR
jgi:hypothetical protein